MKHYTNKKTNEVFGYETESEAKRFNQDYKNLVKMSDELFKEYRDNRPVGGEWTYRGWVIDEELLAKELEEKKQQELNVLNQKLESIERDIARLERIKDRTDEESEELERLIEESTELYREIKEAK